MSLHQLYVEPSRDLPLVHFQVIIPTGGLEDPAGLEGLTRLCSRAMRRGAGARDARTIDETLDALGAELAIETGYGHVRFAGVTIRRSLEPTLALLSEILDQPTFPEEDVLQVKRETEAALVELTDNDQSLVNVHFRRALFAGHPYGRPIIGTRASIAAITREHVLQCYRGLCRRTRIVGMAGDVSAAEAERLTARFFEAGCGALGSVEAPAAAAMRPGRHLRIVDKPERTQTQIQIGGLGTHPRDADHTALLVGNAIFGGTFTSRLTRAVRSERGWSYGASSRLAVDRIRETFSMWTFPAATDAAACIALELSLLEELIERGIDAEELAFAQSYLVKSYAFAVDTAEKRLDQLIDLSLHELPSDYFSGYTERIRRVTRDEVNAALRQRLSARDLVLAVVATDAELGDKLRALPEISSAETIAFDDEGVAGGAPALADDVKS